MAEAHLPLLVFPQAKVVAPDAGKPFPRSKPHMPGHGTQVDRLAGQLEELQQAFERYRASIGGALAGLEPESVLVMEIAGSVDDFKQAVEAAGLEWLGEWDTEDIEPTEDFFEVNKDGNRTAKPLKGRLFLSMSNEAGLNELLGLWRQWRENRQFPHGKTKWCDVFDQLRVIRRWRNESLALRWVTTEHQAYLAWHRSRVFQAGKPNLLAHDVAADSPRIYGEKRI